MLSTTNFAHFTEPQKSVLGLLSNFVHFIHPYMNPLPVVLLKGEEKNRGHWKIGIVNHLYNGKDNIRVAQLRIGKK